MTDELLLTAEMSAEHLLRESCKRRLSALRQARNNSAYKAARTRERRTLSSDPVWREMHGD